MEAKNGERKRNEYEMPDAEPEYYASVEANASAIERGMPSVPARSSQHDDITLVDNDLYR